MLKLSLIFWLAILTFAGCTAAKPEASTPSLAFKAYIEAANRKDAAAIKQSLSKGSIKMLEETAKMQGVTLDETLKNQSNPGSNTVAMPETRSEKIEGGNATLEIKNAQTGTWDKVYFALEEDGRWKIALDKFMEEMMKGTEGEPNSGATK